MNIINATRLDKLFQLLKSPSIFEHYRWKFQLCRCQKNKKKIKENYGFMIHQPYPELENFKGQNQGLKNADILMLAETLVTEAEMWEQPKCPSNRENLQKCGATEFIQP